jgi:hypothetical protein
MDEETGQKTSGFEEIQTLIEGLLYRMQKEFRSV